MFTIFLCAALYAQHSSSISPSEFFHEARQAWQVERGHIWGRSLVGPLLLVDPKTRQVWASEPDAEGQLKDQQGVFTGILPNDVGVANTAMEWAGKRWSMVLLPLPDKALERQVLLIHESWHRIQPSLGLDVPDLLNGHLDKLEGRYWLQLEWRALSKALVTSGKTRQSWVAAALACRTQRQSLFPNAVEAERSLELKEGLAEYTGIRAAGARNLAMEKLQKTEGPFARSFAYASGPAYGLLLDAAAPGWTRRVRRATDLSVLLQEAYHLRAATSADAEVAAAKLGGHDLRAQEEIKDKARQQRLATITEPLITGPTLRVPGPFHVQFNPSNTEALEGGAAYHPTATYRGDWGRLEVTGGSLRSGDWSEARVIAPTDQKARPLTGPGWTLELAPGWILLAVEPVGSFKLGREKKEM